MNKSLTYRLVTAGLILVFAVFNIGLPIVLASCPMMKAGGMKSCCAPNAPTTASQQLERSMSSDCCKTVIAGERNTNEFVQSQFQLQHIPSLEFVITPTISLFSTSAISPEFTSLSALPNSADDIPIVTSSLRI